MKKKTVGAIPLLYIEPDGPAGNRPLVIWLPGFSGSKEGQTPQLEDLAQRGFVAVSFDPREHGHRLIDTLDELRARVHSNIRRYFWPIMAGTVEDASTVIDWAIADLGVSDRIGVGGISMGGDIAVAAAGLDERIGAVAAAIATADWLRPGSFEESGWADEGARAAYDQCNPLTHLEQYGRVPAISFQSGSLDQQVPADGGQRFVAALQARYPEARERCDVVLHEGTGHQFTPEMWGNCLGWFERWLR